MNKKIIITSDSTTDLGEDLIARYNVKILPLGVTLGDKSFQDGVDISPDFIYDHYNKTGELPKTSAANIDDCINFFKSLVDQGYAIIHFTISSNMSSTFNNARLAAMEFDDVYVVDTKNLSTGGGLLVITAAQMALDGKDATEILEYVTQLTEKIDASFVIDDLEFLHKGGRCSALAAFGANLLKLKPCVSVRDGKMGVTKKYRGKFSSVLAEYIDDTLADLDNIEPDYVFVTHAGCDESIVNACVEQVKQKGYFKELFLTRAGCTVSAHCGKNTLGVLFIRKTPLN